MNAHAQMSGQVPGRVPSQASPQLPRLSQQNGSSFHSQMQNLGSQTMDPEIAISRQNMQAKIIQILQSKNSNPFAEWLHRLPELAKRLEEFIFRGAASKEDYMNMAMGTIEQRIQAILKNTPNNNHPLSHPISSSSSISTMIPTPGMQHSGSSNSIVSCSADNSIITSNGAGVVAQSAVNTGNLLTAANGSAGIGHNASFNASDGSIPNRYQQSPANFALGSGGNSIMSSISISRQLSQMIPTPGLNNPQPTAINSECSNGVGFSGIDSTMVSQQQQQKQYVGSQNSRLLHSIGGQIAVGSRSNFQQKSTPYVFSNGVMNGGLGLIGSNMQLVNGPAASDGNLTTTSYGRSPKPSQQQFDQQHHQPMLPTSLSQQMLPMTGDGYAMNTVDLSTSGSLYSSASSVVSTMNNQNMNPMSLHTKLKTNHAVVNPNTSLQTMQQPPQIASQNYDHSQKINFHSPQLTREHLLQSQHRIQNFQQQPNQPYAQLVQHQQPHQQQQQSQQQQQLMLKTDTLRQCSITSSFGGQQIPEHGFESHNEPIFPQVAEQCHPSELQSQYQQKSSAGNHSKGAQLLDQLSGPLDFHPSLSQGSDQMLHLHQQVTESQNEYNSLFSGSQPDALQQGHLLPQTLQKPQMMDKSSFDQHIQEEFRQRLAGQEEAQQPHFEGCVTGHAADTRSASVLQSSSGVACGPGNSTREMNYHKQQRWLLFLIHARKCSAPKGTCTEVNCIKVQQLWMHMERCNLNQCRFPRCCPSKKIVGHYGSCRATDCPVCIPVRDFVASNRKARSHPVSDTGLVNQTNDSLRNVNTVGADSMVTKTNALSFETSEVSQPVKRMKVQHTHPILVPKRESSPASVSVLSQPHVFQEVQPQQADITMCAKSEVADVKVDTSVGSGQGNPPIFCDTVDENVHTAMLEIEPLISNDVVGHIKHETMLIEKDNDQVKIEAKQEANAPTADPVAGSKSGKPKIKGVSLTELFTPEQIRDHIVSLRQWVGQSKAKAEKNQAMEHSMSENSCQLCAVEKLTFEPPPIYCTPCGARIKRNAAYYTIGSGDTRHYFCVPCYNEARGDTIDVDGSAFTKARLEKKKNDEETEEWWVQCDKCEAWQHQICALFNGRRNDGGQAEYTCPNCYTEEIEKGERKPLPQSAVLGAKDLPRTILSDHIEQRLIRRLKQERQERARHLGKSFDEVPGAESLVIRVVSSVDKKLEVKQRFLEIFQEENYPTEYPYKSKVVLLFQKIEGVEVCLFGMYVQEFGSECQFPNQRRVYLSYLDSVKYFRPDTRTVTGEALRTFVYHEILIGYLEYCKKRGFTSCYIWACPPLKGEDYILYCHPEIQKTPKSDKLREWYLSMLRKAAKENIVVELTNLYDHFFTTVGECKAKVTAARLPYFDGDYWPGAAEDMINQLRQEEDGKKLLKKGKTKKTLTKRALKAAGQTDLTGNASKDALLMQKLGETICPMKEDFIMVHLQHACAHCCLLMASGARWVCNQCKNFQLCDKCHDSEQRLEERDKHPNNSREKHVLCPVEINDVPSDTKDKDEILESEFFDTRQAFLSLCQGNHYQYDTLRRAKHSSMMVLYHLHNPTAPAFVTTCNVCHHDIETGQGWRCEICPDFDVCNACYQKDGGVDHPHKLTNHPSIADRDAQNQEARQKRVLQLRKMLDLLVHASQCRFPHCQYPNCRKVKGLFRHGIQCKTRASGGCPLCKKMWYLLQLHARACKESDCRVPRCKDLKEHLKRLQQQSDSRRRAAVMEMMRQRAAEVAGSTD